MAERKREIQVKFWVTPEEKKMIRKKMILSRTANMGAYLRKMAIDGIIVNTDTTYLEKQFFEMHKIGVNVNQLARLANATGSVTPEEMKELKGMIKEIIICQARLSPFSITLSFPSFAVIANSRSAVSGEHP